MSPVAMLFAILGILLLLALAVRLSLPLPAVKQTEPVQIRQVRKQQPVKAVEHNPFLEPKTVVYEREEDPLMYIDDGTYYRQPIMIEGNRVWVEDKRPQINDLEWGQPLYTDRWANGLYNGSYKTYS